MGDPVKKRRRHFGVTKDRDPFTELQIGGNDDTGLLIELADQVEDKRSAGFREWNITQFINDDTIRLTKLTDNFTGIAFSLFFDQGVYEINCIMEPNFLALCDEGGSQGNGNMGFTGSSPANKDQIMGIFRELSGAHLLYLSLFYSG